MMTTEQRERAITELRYLTTMAQRNLYTAEEAAVFKDFDAADVNLQLATVHLLEARKLTTALKQ